VLPDERQNAKSLVYGRLVLARHCDWDLEIGNRLGASGVYWDRPGFRGWHVEVFGIPGLQVRETGGTQFGFWGVETEAARRTQEKWTEPI
jgi:hypothetical protein